MAEEVTVEADEELIHNSDLDAEISRIQHFKEIGDQFRGSYKEAIRRLQEVVSQMEVQEESTQKDLEGVQHKKILFQELTAKELASLEEELSANTREEESIKSKEKVLVDQLRQIRNQLARNETARKGLHKWLLDMRQKHESAADEIHKEEHYVVREHEIVLAISRAAQLLSQLADGMYWMHTRQYGAQMQQNESFIGNKMRTLERSYRRSVGTAFANKQRDGPILGTIMIYHKICLSHEVPKDHLEKPDRLRVTISVISELKSLFPEDLDVFTNPPEVEQRYLYLVHDPRYVNKLRSLIPVSNNTTSSAPTISAPSLPALPPGSTMPSPSTPPSPPEPLLFESSSVSRSSHKSTLLHIDYLLDVHSEVDGLRSSNEKNVPNGSSSPLSEEEEERDPNLYDTFVSPLSLHAAFRAAGAVCEAVDAVMRGGYTRAFCAVRPPGHHVGRMGRTKNVPSQGFCLLNNVAIGAKYALFTTGLERIAIVDFDVHHGNGTQEVLEGDSNFMFFSIHVHDQKKFFYPGTGGECHPSECGSCDSESGSESFDNVVNVPLRRGATSSSFLHAFSTRIIQGLIKFEPQLILLSAGFDGHRDDPTNGLKLAEEDYHTITKLLKRVAQKCCQGRIVSVLEGGYALEGRNSAFRRSVYAHLRALVQDDDDFEDEELNTESSKNKQALPRKGSIQSLLL